ncbi:Tex family protein [Macrococcus bovicus]|uniref:Tex family protein n=1 Tax=Macrococcus bovicus TaxID=69968 RepID=UPI0025A52181|nr:Tex family protein [Macrococcus bovicus]WJP97550.1 Tex family protein [Macrococcus bovicus]
MEKAIINLIIEKLPYKNGQIEAVLNLLEEKNTVPFIARYRKEMTGGLDEVEIKEIETEYNYMAALQKRKEDVIKSIDAQGLLTEELRTEIQKQTKLQRVEDLYRPFKQKKKTRATEAKRKNLGPLADKLLKFEDFDSRAEAERYLNDEVETWEEAVKGAMDIVAEVIADDPKYRAALLKSVQDYGEIHSQKKKNAEDEKQVFEMYYDYSERISKVVPHRTLAINRGEELGILKVSIEHDLERQERYIKKQFVKKTTQNDALYDEVITDSLKRLILPSIEREIRSELTAKAEAQAIEIFSVNLKNLLLQPPLKGRVILGVDPAYRTGCKLAVINEYGTFIAKSVMYPHPPVNKKAEAEEIFVDMVTRYQVELIAIGNGTASRETEQFVAEMIKKHQLKAAFIIVNEAGASVYSASELARQEFPDFKVEERSAVSIGRRVQDPLSELVKIDPKSIGVGQYQHDVNQKSLTESLSFIVETAVNQVGVNVNTASLPLLQRVSGLSTAVANNIIKHREENGPIRHHKEIARIPRLGAKTFEQSIGFLRIMDGSEPLDQTAIHPESYKATYQLLEQLDSHIDELGTDTLKAKLQTINTADMARAIGIGEMTLQDIITALIAPGRDPRDDYEVPLLKSDVLSLEDLKKGMKLSGTVRNVVDFGAFVDIGVKQDGLVHISKLSDRFVKHPTDVVSVGDIVEVWVETVDVEKGKVGLTMKDPQ